VYGIVFAADTRQSAHARFHDFNTCFALMELKAIAPM
jgi:hypothetical protein